MKLTWRILLCFLVFTALGFYFLMNWMRKDLRPRYLESLEETLVDSSQLLASQLELDARNKKIQTGNLRRLFDNLYRKNFSAKIYDLTKTRVDLRAYVTDAKGVVLYHSTDPDAVGMDYSRWNDVLLTLQGKYGARSTRTDPKDPNSSVLYIAAPVVFAGKLQGLVSVGKPTHSVSLFIEAAQRKILTTSLLIFLGVLGLTLAVSLWISLPVQRLTRYAQAVKAGQRAPLPPLGNNEMGDLGRAFEEMREALEGKKYVEQYVQLLTHEIKGPLSAIRGAAELMEEKMPAAKRKKFMANIRSESARIQDIVERLLLLASVENRKVLEKTERIALRPLVGELLASLRSAGHSKKITFRNEIPKDAHLRGDTFLVRQALANLIQNAVEFSSKGGKINLFAKAEGPTLEIRVEDEGPGIPSYALDRIFEKFYSLQRPDTGRKSSGLGLSLVREVANLHGGKVLLENRSGGGTRAILTLPLDPSS
jgi:two-component system, OmpR family, sensor histidine kinase CreC